MEAASRVSGFYLQDVSSNSLPVEHNSQVANTAKYLSRGGIEKSFPGETVVLDSRFAASPNDKINTAIIN